MSSPRVMAEAYLLTVGSSIGVPSGRSGFFVHDSSLLYLKIPLNSYSELKHYYPLSLSDHLFVFKVKVSDNELVPKDFFGYRRVIQDRIPSMTSDNGIMSQLKASRVQCCRRDDNTIIASQGVN